MLPQSIPLFELTFHKSSSHTSIFTCTSHNVGGISLKNAFIVLGPSPSTLHLSFSIASQPVK